MRLGCVVHSKDGCGAQDMMNRSSSVKHTKKYPLETTLSERHKTKMAKGCDHDGEGCYRAEKDGWMR